VKAKFLFDPRQAVKHLRASDERMRLLIDRVGLFDLELKPVRSLFEAMLRSIIYQQLHGKAAAAIHARVLTVLAKNGGVTPEALAAAPDADLRGAGLSGNKLLAVRDLAAKCLEGTVPSLKEAHKLSDDELVERLTAVRGIGPWTVHMLLIFYLGRPDVFPTGDFAVRLALKKLYRKRQDPSPAAMLKHAKAWQPYRSIASWYLWRSLDTEL
jgi:3-methyladenine DNA glycosylase/8-oxoguanine DNA glycosylase